MFNITDLTPAQLRQAADIKEKINTLKAEFNEILGTTSPEPAKPTKKYQYRLTGAKSGRVSLKNKVNLTSLPKSSKNGHKKLHWTQTPAGRERCRQNVLNRHKSKERTAFVARTRKNLAGV